MPAMNLHLAHPSAWGTEQGIHRAMRARPPPPESAAFYGTWAPWLDRGGSTHKFSAGR